MKATLTGFSFNSNTLTIIDQGTERVYRDKASFVRALLTNTRLVGLLGWKSYNYHWKHVKQYDSIKEVK